MVATRSPLQEASSVGNLLEYSPRVPEHPQRHPREYRMLFWGGMVNVTLMDNGSTALGRWRRHPPSGDQHLHSFWSRQAKEGEFLSTHP